MTLVLASTSLRRYQILSLLHLPFWMVPPGVEEKPTTLSPSEETIYWAGRKARAIAARFPGAVIIGSDTLISLEGEKIGKPETIEGAVEILTRLRGRTHEVVTAIAIVAPTQNMEHVETSSVTMRNYTDDEMERYVRLGECMDKAGAYSVQGVGGSLVEAVKGDYLSVVGLPLRAAARALERVGMHTPLDVEGIYQERKVLNWPVYDLTEPGGRTNRKKTAFASPSENPSTGE